MTIRWGEKPTSDAVTSESASLVKQYFFAGSTDHSVAWAYAASMAPTMALAAGQVLYRQDVRITCVGFDMWDVEVPYGKLDKTVGSYRFSFSTTGGTVNIKQAKSHTAHYPNVAGNNNEGAIDVEGDTVHGTEIVIPTGKATYTFKHPLGIVNESLMQRMLTLTGQTNSAAWHGFKAGECLFLGATASDGSDADAEVAYEFAISRELSNVTIGPITGVSKKGWEIAWSSFLPVPAGGKPIRKVEYISVERVYDSFAFATELGF